MPRARQRPKAIGVTIVLLASNNLPLPIHPDSALSLLDFLWPA